MGLARKPASATAQGEVTTGEQTFAGDKTFLGVLNLKNINLAGDGIPTWSTGTDRGYAGGKITQYTFDGRPINGANTQIRAGTYIDGSTNHRAIANQTGARLGIYTRAALTDSAFHFDVDQSLSHAADSVGSFTAILTGTVAGAWTVGPAGGLGGSLAGLTVQGGNLVGGTNAADGAIRLGSNATYGGALQFSDVAATTLYIDSLYNSNSAKILFRMKTAATPVNVGYITGDSVWTLGDGALGAGTAVLVLTKSNAINNRLIAGYDAATRGYIRINSAQTNLEFESSSDRRIKTNIQPLTGSLAKILALNPVSYERKDNPGVECLGHIAQEFADVFPSAVTKTDSGEGDEMPEGVEPWSMSDAVLMTHFVKAIQELKAENDALKARLDALEGAA